MISSRKQKVGNKEMIPNFDVYVLRPLVRGGKSAGDLKWVLTEDFAMSPVEAERAMQDALNKGIVCLGDGLKLYPGDGVPMSEHQIKLLEQLAIRTQVESIDEQVADLFKKKRDIQESCEHMGELTYKYCGSSGNYDPSNDAYWIQWNCKDCGKSWTTDQNYDEVRKYPNAKEIKK